jgi:hypothetical protein
VSLVRIALALSLVASLSFSPRAEAQPRGDTEALARAVGTFRAEAERRGLHDVAQSAAELERRAWRGGGRRGGPGRLQEAYRDLRRLTFANGARMDDVILDAWDVVAAEALDVFGMPTGPIVGPVPPVTPISPAPQPAYRFDGAFESMAVAFEGDHAQLHAQCLQFVQSSRITHVDDVRLADGRNVHNSSSYWNADQLCSLAVLNARELWAMTPIAEGVVEDVPFRVAGDVRGLLTAYLPRLLAGNRWIDDVTINGRAYHNSAGYWTPDQATQMILLQIGTTPTPVPPVPTPVPPPPSGRTWVAEGVIEGRAFRISAPIAQQIEPACQGFLQNQRVQLVRSITVNGRTYRQQGGAAWDVRGACQLVASQAVQQ